jgi:hypothetical protein
MFYRSSSAGSSHLNLGFPTRRVPSDLRTVSSCILKRCPSRLSLPIFITLTMSSCRSQVCGRSLAEIVGHGCLSLVSVVCCHVWVSATS